MKELMQKALTVLSQRKDISAGAEQQGLAGWHRCPLQVTEFAVVVTL